MSAAPLLVPRGNLPEDAGERFRFLSAAFERLVADATPHDGGWRLELRRPGAAASYVDPRLEEGLRWFSPQLLVSDIHLGLRLEEGFQISLDDGWTLFSWCNWLQGEEGRPRTPSVLHLDSHADLMSPRISREEGREERGWRDLITGEAVDLGDPLTVVNALRSGAIGIGSFMVPFIHQMPGLRLFHLCPRVRLQRAPGAYALEPSLGDGDPIFAGARRPRVELRPLDEAHGQGVYVLGADAADLISQIPTGPVLLHIDLDYFNDRFDGCPDWAARPERHDPPRGEILAAIDAFFDTLAASPAAAAVEDVTVAFSPGFFPAEFWEPAVDRVRHGVARLGGGR